MGLHLISHPHRTSSTDSTLFAYIVAASDINNMDYGQHFTSGLNPTQPMDGPDPCSSLIHDLPMAVKKGKADHARMGVGGVLISLTLAVSQVDKPLSLCRMGRQTYGYTFPASEHHRPLASTKLYCSAW